MDAFQKLADAAVPTFTSVVGYSMTDFVMYAKALVLEFIGAPIVFVMYNRDWMIAWLVIIIIVAFAVNFLTFFRLPGTRPARR